MGYRITAEILQRIKDENDIVTVVSGYLTLKKSGRSYKAICPFHGEKTPSFIVTPEKGIFHCFGCGAGGDSISFVMRMENLLFPEAAALLAKRAGIQLELTREDGEANRVRTRLLQLNNEAAAFYHRCLTREKEGQPGRDYLQKRKITAATVKEFNLGFAPSGYPLERHLTAAGFSRAEIEAAGLKFFLRVIFPIYNLSSECLGFGGRTVTDAEPKYLNSPETPVFSKGAGLYGLSLSRQPIQQKGELLLVEGYLDLIKVYQHGFRNVAAGLGTALTPTQARLIRRFTDRVVLLYDGDRAGRLAARRNLEVLLANDLEISVVTLPDQADPDSYLDQHGPEALNKILAGDRKNPLLFQLEMAALEQDLSRPEARINAAREILPLCQVIESPLRRSEYMSQLAEALQLHEEALRQEFHNLQKKSEGRRVETPAVPAPKRKPGLHQAEEILLAAALCARELRLELARRLTEDHFSDPEHRAVFRKLVQLPETATAEMARAELEGTVQNTEEFLVRVGNLSESEELLEQNFQGCLNRILAHSREERLTRPLRTEKIDGVTDPDLEDLRRFQALIQERHQHK
ncbi:MAG TPA: DNA primase [bacterium]|nr:DNA primase [bacterium]HNS48061.1 DNA primase [bacterium]